MKKIVSVIVAGILFVHSNADAQIGKRFSSESKIVKDPVTGVSLHFLTSSPAGDSKIYQTHPQWTADGQWVIFRSNRARNEALAVNEQTGEIVQVSEGGYTGMLNVARKSMKLYLMRNAGSNIELVEVNLQKVFDDSKQGRMKAADQYQRVCGTIPAALGAGGDMALDAEEDQVYFRVGKAEAAKHMQPGAKIESNFGPRNMGAGPAGLMSMHIQTGELKWVVAVPFQIGHVQTNPFVKGEIVFCWETGGKSPQRTWTVMSDGSGLRPLYPEADYEWVTHEAVITKDEVAFALMGHRKVGINFKVSGTSGPDGKPVTDPLNPGQEEGWGNSGTREKPTGLGIVNLRTREMTIIGQTPSGSGLWHVNGSADGRWAVGDDFSRNVYLIDRHTREMILLSAGHKATAADHPHPTFSADGTKIEIQSAMLSEDNKSMNICIIPVPEEWLKRTYPAGNANAMATGLSATTAEKEKINDFNTPLHLMKPDYHVPYGVLDQAGIKSVTDRVLHFLEAATPARLINKETKSQVTDVSKIDKNTVIETGTFRLSSYEWGVTYSAMLLAAKTTGDSRYKKYVSDRFQFLGAIAPSFKKLSEEGIVEPQMRQILNPKALDDAGAVCASMIKAKMDGIEFEGRPLIDNYMNFIMNKEYHLKDGTYGRNRPQNNTVWLDDMYMAIPSIVNMGKLTGDQKYYDEALKQMHLFFDKMFIKEKGIYRHGWVESMNPHPAFHWGRANGWALLTTVEVLDALPDNYPGRAAILDMLKAHVKGLTALQSGEGFWHQLLDREDSYLETSCTAIYTYCIAHAINKGWIDPVAYGPVATLGWHAVESKVNQAGEVEGTCVGTGMAFDPAFYYYRPVHKYAAHGYGPVLLAGAEMIELLKKYQLKINDSSLQFYQ